MSRRRPRIAGTFERHESVKALYLVPSPRMPGLTAAERLALTVRRDATLAGRCVCGATFPPVVRARAGELASLEMEHEADCPAAHGPTLDRMLERIGRRAIEYEPVVVELEVER